jgi:hypothetical protein
MSMIIRCYSCPAFISHKEIVKKPSIKEFYLDIFKGYDAPLLPSKPISSLHSDLFKAPEQLASHQLQVSQQIVQKMDSEWEHLL